MMRFVQPSEHQVLLFLIQIALLLVVARVLGQLCRRFGQPAVVGELAAGVVLGPSVLGRIAPGVFEWVFPPGVAQSAMLFAVGWLGVILLLVVTGFETDLALISRLGKAAVLVTAGSLLVPFAFGLGGGLLAPESLMGDDAERTVFALFLATALTISSLPVIAKILSELQLLRRNFGQLTLAVAMANDVIGWVLLGLIAGLAGSGRLEVGDLFTTILGLLVFLALAAAVGQRLIDAILHQMRRRDVGIGGWVTMSIAIALGLGAVTQALGVEAVLGAFIGGILLGRSRYSRHDVEEQLETITVAIVAPIFFATAGLRVDLSLLADPEVALWAVVVTLIASISKFGGSLIGARLSGLAGREGTALGVALNARGALEIVVATVGLSLGVLNEASYTIVVIMAIATSVMAPPLLRSLTRDWVGSGEEQERLERERQLASKVLLRPGRALFVATDTAASAYAARFLDLVLPAECPVTIVDGDVASTDPDPAEAVEHFVEREVEHLPAKGDPTQQVVDQSALGYQLTASAIDVPANGALSAIADALIVRSTLPTLLVQSGDDDEARVHHILLPASATHASRAASEVAIALAAATGATLHVLYVDAQPGSGPGRRIWRATMRSGERTVASYAGSPADGLFSEVEEAAGAVGVRTERISIRHQSRSAAISTIAGQIDADVIVLGVAAQTVAEHAFLGQTTERVLRTASTAVAVVAM